MRSPHPLVALAAMAALLNFGGVSDAHADAAVAASGPSRAEAPADTVPSADEAEEEGVFVVERNGAPLLTERFTRTADRLTTELSAEGEERVTQTATLTPDGTVSRLELRVFAAGADAGAPPRERAVMRLRGDTAVVHVQEEGRANTALSAVPDGTIVFPLEESVAMVEQVLRRARQVGGERVEVPVLTEGGETQRLTVTFTGPTTALVEGEGTELSATVDSVGRLLAARSESRGLTIRREPAAAAQP